MLESINSRALKVKFNGQNAEIVGYKVRPLGDYEILVKTHCSMISIGTESQALTCLAYDKWFRENPGYALAGDVIRTGSLVNDFKVGDRVVSLTNHCSYAICSAEQNATLKIPEGISYEDSIFCVLGSVALHGLRRADAKLGESITIFGAGIVGLLAVKFAKMIGLWPIITIDISQKRLEFAREKGADYFINPNKENIVKKVREYAGGDGTNIVYEAVGNPDVLQNAFQVCATGGRVVTLGNMTGARCSLDIFTDFIDRQQTLIAAQQPTNLVYDNIYYHFGQISSRKYILDLIKKKQLSVSDLITHKFSYRKVPEVYEIIKNGKISDYRGETSDARNLIGVILNWMD